jgi:hypothetical protein
VGALALNLWRNLLGVSLVREGLAQSDLGSTGLKTQAEPPRWMSLSSLQPNGGGGCGR